MNTDTQLAAPYAAQSPLGLIQLALADTGVSPEKMAALLAVKKDWEADEARKAYNRAVSEFQRRAPIIEKADKAYDKEYARLDRIWRTIRPLLTELGLSITWQVCELRDGLCRVEGQLRHRDGHGERIVQDIPVPELIKGQNKAQQMGSASTYAKRYALTGALGIVTGDDDDGHAAGAVFVGEDQARQIAELIDAARGIADFNEPAFWKFAGATCPQDVQAGRFVNVCDMLRRKLGGAK